MVFFSFFKCVFNQSVGATNKKQQQIERKKKLQIQIACTTAHARANRSEFQYIIVVYIFYLKWIASKTKSANRTNHRAATANDTIHTLALSRKFLKQKQQFTFYLFVYKSIVYVYAFAHFILLRVAPWCICISVYISESKWIGLFFLF